MMRFNLCVLCLCVVGCNVGIPDTDGPPKKAASDGNTTDAIFDAPAIVAANHSTPHGLFAGLHENSSRMRLMYSTTIAAVVYSAECDFDEACSRLRLVKHVTEKMQLRSEVEFVRSLIESANKRSDPNERSNRRKIGGITVVFDVPAANPAALTTKSVPSVLDESFLRARNADGAENSIPFTCVLAEAGDHVGEDKTPTATIICQFLVKRRVKTDPADEVLGQKAEWHLDGEGVVVVFNGSEWTKK